jgi:hypothetical protein
MQAGRPPFTLQNCKCGEKSAPRPKLPFIHLPFSLLRLEFLTVDQIRLKVWLWHPRISCFWQLVSVFLPPPSMTKCPSSLPPVAVAARPLTPPLPRRVVNFCRQNPLPTAHPALSPCLCRKKTMPALAKLPCAYQCSRTDSDHRQGRTVSCAFWLLKTTRTSTGSSAKR